jgi:hypothetical protein
LMTSVSVSSCSSDDDDDSTTTTPTYTSFHGIVDGDDELNIARSLSINDLAGSFLSIKDGKIYTSTASADELKDVEIVFNGTNFVTAASSANPIVSTNGNSATLTTNANGTIAYVTSTGYMGTIMRTGATGFIEIGSSDVTVTVKHISCQQVYYSPNLFINQK